jgi:hypothetical protein
MVKTHVSGSGFSNFEAIQGCTAPLLSMLSSLSNAAVCTRWVGTSPTLAMSIEPGGDWMAHTIVSTSTPAAAFSEPPLVPGVLDVVSSSPPQAPRPTERISATAMADRLEIVVMVPPCRQPGQRPVALRK